MSDPAGSPGTGVEGASSGGVKLLDESARRSTLDARSHLSPNQGAWRRFRRNRLASASGLFLLAAIVLVLIWPVFQQRSIAPHLPKAMAWSPVALSEEQFQPPGAG